MKFVIGGALLVLLLVVADAGPVVAPSSAMVTLHDRFEDQYFKVFKRSLLHAGMQLGEVQQFKEVLKDVEQVEVFEIDLEGSIDCNALNKELQAALDKEKFDELMTISGPQGEVVLFAWSDSTSIRQLIGFTTDSTDFRVIELLGSIDMKSLVGMGPTGMTNILKNPLFK